MQDILPAEGLLVGRAKVPGFAYPRVVTVRNGRVLDITSKAAPTVRDICEMSDPVGHVAGAAGTDIGSAADIAANSAVGAFATGTPSLLSPIDLHAVKAAGVTFVRGLVEELPP